MALKIANQNASFLLHCEKIPKTPKKTGELQERLVNVEKTPTYSGQPKE